MSDFGIGGAVVGGIGALLQYSAQQEANQIAWSGLNFQKQNADKNFRLGTSTRTDAYGNKQRYNDATNEWETLLTPTQNQVVKAGEHEQLLSLTEDANRNRDIRRNAYQRALDAVPQYKAAIAGYKYDQPPTEAAIRSQILDALTQGSQEVVNANKGNLTTQALRLGRGGDIPAIIKASNDDLGSKLGNSIAQSRQAAFQEHGQRQQQHDQQYLPEIQMWDKLVNESAPDAAVQFSNVPQQLGAMQGQQAGQISNALTSGASGIGGAYNQLGKALGASPDLSGIARSLSSGGGKRTASGQDSGWYNTPEYKAWNSFGDKGDPFLNGPTGSGQQGNYNWYTGASDNNFDNGYVF